MRINNDLEFQIGRYQLRVTCFDIILTETRAEVWVSLSLLPEIDIFRSGRIGYS